MKMDEFMDDDLKYYEDKVVKKKEKKRSDLVSKKLGELLLQGFRMLNSTCDKCDCILMQKKNEPVYCVGCQDPDVIAIDLEQPDRPVLIENPVISQAIIKSPNEKTVIREIPIENSSKQQLSTIEVIKAKISWATEQLKKSNVMSYDIELLELIKKSSEAIEALKKADI